MGLLHHVRNCGVFPPVDGDADEALSLATNFDEHENYSSVDGDEYAHAELERLLARNYLRAFDTLE
eukprot:3110172-Lingulodinium_polyedra.AAC.1